MRDKPQHVGQGLTKGFKRFGSGVFGGVTGVITQPIQVGGSFELGLTRKQRPNCIACRDLLTPPPPRDRIV